MLPRPKRFTDAPNFMRNLKTTVKHCNGITNPVARSLPDGLDNLTVHNLLSYKSLHEPLDGWTIKELIGHYVNYRKQVSPSSNQLVPESQFQLYGISTRFPNKLQQLIPLKHLTQGIYDINWGADKIRIIVLSEIPEGEHNAIWRLFSAKREAVIAARNQYHIHQTDMSTIVQQLFENYQQENIDMTYTVKDFQKDYVLDHLNLVSADEVLKRYSPDDILSHLSPANLKMLMEKLAKQ